MKRREFLTRAGQSLLVGSALLAQGRRAKAARKPNIIFILADDMGYADVGAYGQLKIQTPHIDDLAAEGVQFTQCYAGSATCAPSRCCLMTGKHTGHATIRGNSGPKGARIPLKPEDVTIAEVLKGAGYATGVIGKWGLGEDGSTGVPNAQGFDEFYGYLNQDLAENYYPPDLWRNQTVETIAANQNGAQGAYSHDLFTNEALSFVQRHKDEPFFLYLAYTIPHATLTVPDTAPYTDKAWTPEQKIYAAMITRMDKDIGRLMALLKNYNLNNDTVVMFASDNGPNTAKGADPVFFDSNGPLRGFKRDLYEGGIRIPFVVRWPGQCAPGQSEQVCAFWDVLPTCAAFAGVAPPAGIDGVSMLPTLLCQTQPSAPYLYWEFYENGFIQAARQGNWKGIRSGLHGAMEIYNLKSDPGETSNVAAAQPAIVTQMQNIMAAAHTDSPYWAPS